MRLAETRAERPLLRNDVGMVKRAFDVAVSALALIALAPLMLAIALAICIESGRPVIFSQIRMGQYGRHFRVQKFRKFRHVTSGGDGDSPAVSQGGAVTLRDDPRMTRVGRLLARTKMDELPQFWNVLNGDMSLVGPRPESFALADCYDRHYQTVLNYRPGIFGPNQVFFRSEWLLYTRDADPETFYREVLFPLKVRVDLAYFSHGTMRGDLAWIVCGVCAVLGAKFPRSQEAGLIPAVEAWIRQNARA